MSQVHRQNVIELAAGAVRTSTLTGTAVDLAGYDGVAHLILQSSAATAGTAPTLDCKLQDCATVGGSYADVTGATFAQVTTSDSTEMITVKVQEIKQFVKLIGTIGGTATPTFGFGVSMVATRAHGRNASQAV